MIKTIIFELEIDTELSDNVLLSQFNDFKQSLIEHPTKDVKLLEGNIKIINDDKQAEASV